MKCKRLVLAVLFLVAVGGLPGVPSAAQALLPSSLGEWTSPAVPSQVSPQQIEQLAGDRANILREYGIAAGERREYVNGNDKATVTLYRMVDPSAAFGVFTFLRDPDMVTPAPIASASYAAGKRGRTLLVVEVKTELGSLEDLLRRLDAKVRLWRRRLPRSAALLMA